MKAVATAKGNATRQANKARRRQAILDIARDLIATQGFDAFTISELADRAGVSIPTVHNLFGRKHDIVEELVGELVTRIDEVLGQPEVEDDPLVSTVAFIDSLLALYREDEAFYRAAFMAGERHQLFEHEMESGIFNKSLKIAHRLCTRARENGFLAGQIDSLWIAEQLFGCQRLARQDWVNGYIDLERYRRQVLVGMLMTYAADATPAFHERLCEALDELTRD